MEDKISVKCCLYLVVLLCCMFDCRIPRTKQEIEADYEKRALLKRYKEQLIAQPMAQRGRQRGAEKGSGNIPSNRQGRTADIQGYKCGHY